MVYDVIKIVFSEAINIGFLRVRLLANETQDYEPLQLYYKISEDSNKLETDCNY